MKRMIRYVSLATTFFMLVSCGAPAYMHRVQDLIGRGQCSAAENEIYENESDPATRAVMLAGVADECHRDRARTISFLTLGARYGHPVAQEELALRGQPIPPVDLGPRNTNCVVLGGLLSCSSN